MSTTPIDDLIVRAVRGLITPAEEARLLEWRRADPANERRFRETEAIWAATSPEYMGRHVPAPPPIERIVAGPTGITARPSRSVSQRRARIPAIAAAAALVLAIAMLPWMSRNDHDGGVTYEAAEAVDTYSLTDGTIVRLAPGSRLEFRHESVRRTARLEGAAFFAVASDSARPFTIDAGSAVVMVLGTRFELVATGRREVALTLVDGRVRFETSDQIVELQPGQRVTLAPDGSPVIDRVDDPLSALQWPSGLLIFQATPLSQVAREVARHFDQPITVATSLADRAVTGAFDDNNVNDVVNAICAIVDAQCVDDGRALRIQP